jgi:hypothetical protein
VGSEKARPRRRKREAAVKPLAQTSPPTIPTPLPRERDLDPNPHQGHRRQPRTDQPHRIARWSTNRTVHLAATWLTLLWMILPDEIRDALLTRLAG